jgi:hypothetical protein
MQTHHNTLVRCLFALACLFLITGVSAASIQASVGEIIPLSGYSYGSQTVYLFLTGPNLPVNGVALNDITKHADQGYFTRVQVDGDDHWSYKWGTGNLGGRLDSGTYTIWVVNGPNDLSPLSQADYSTISVTLGKPSISVDQPAVPGTMDLKSVPDGASVTMEEKYLGKTPLTLSGLNPGTYTVTFSAFGYQKFVTQIPVVAGGISDVTANLVPDQGALAITSVPAGAGVQVDGGSTGITPVIAGNLTSGNHTVAVSLEGYQPWQQTVTLLPGQILPVAINLSPVSPQKTAAATTPKSGPAPAPLIAGFLAIMGILHYVRRH